MSDTHTEKRREARQRTLLGGRVSFNAEHSTIDCKVRNLSPHGAKLAVTSVLGIPDSVTVRFDSRDPREARVVWRSASELGVTFTTEK